MPEPAEEKHQELVQGLAQRALPPAAQGDVEVVPEPERERDVPAPPEVRYAHGGIGVLEVLGAAEAQRPAQAQGHVAVTGEVEVQLKAVGGGAQPGEPGVQRGARGKRGVRRRGRAAREQQLLRQPQTEAPQPERPVPRGAAAAAQLGFKVLKARERAAHDLREKGDVKQSLAEVLRSRLGPPRGVDNVAYALEGEKAHPRGRGNIGQAQPRAEQRQALPEKAEVFADGQQAEVQHHRQDHGGPAAPHGQQPQQPVHKGRDHQQRRRPELAEAVKHQPRAAQQRVFGLHRPYQRLEHQQQRQEKEQKSRTVETHANCSPYT